MCVKMMIEFGKIGMCLYFVFVFRIVKMYDCRNLNKDFKSWILNGEVENVFWDRFNIINFYVSFRNVIYVYYNIIEIKVINRFSD